MIQLLNIWSCSFSPTVGVRLDGVNKTVATEFRVMVETLFKKKKRKICSHFGKIQYEKSRRLRPLTVKRPNPLIDMNEHLHKYLKTRRIFNLPVSFHNFSGDVRLFEVSIHSAAPSFHLPIWCQRWIYNQHLKESIFKRSARLATALSEKTSKWNLNLL